MLLPMVDTMRPPVPPEPVPEKKIPNAWSVVSVPVVETPHDRLLPTMSAVIDAPDPDAHPQMP